MKILPLHLSMYPYTNHSPLESTSGNCLEKDAKVVLVDDNVRIHLMGVEADDLTADHFIF